ncbi:MAG: HNH endonuclease family protein [Acidimicrobiia bacterium]
MNRSSLRRGLLGTMLSLALVSACGSGDDGALRRSLEVAITTTSTGATTVTSTTTSDTTGVDPTVATSDTNGSPASDSSTPNTPPASESTPSEVPTLASTTTTTTNVTVVPTTVPPAVDPVGLRIETEHPDGYNRDLFRHWVDADGDGCDTRKEVLIAESLEPAQTGSSCAILSGRWYSVYDNTETTDSSRFDIDHVVALKEAWDSGAWSWSADQRRDFANDLRQPFFLIAVSASSNRSKSDRDPAEWLPTNTSYRCEYVRIWIEVKRAWNLSVDQAEHEAIRNILAGC